MGILDDLTGSFKNLNVEKVLITFGVSEDFIQALKKGEIIIPSFIISKKIEDEISKIKGVDVNECICDDSGINLTLDSKRFGAKIQVKTNVLLTDIELDNTTQKIHADYTQTKPLGKNVIGKIVIAIAEGVISNMIDEQIDGNDMIVNSTKDSGINKAVINLEDVPKIKTLKQKVPVLNRSILDLFNIQRIEHVSGAIKVYVHSDLLAKLDL